MDYPLLQHQMPERIKKVWLKSTLFTTLVCLVLGGIGVGVVWWFLQLKGIWLVLLISYFVVTCLISLINLILIPYRYNFHRYEVSPEDLSFQKGYIFREITYVPINRIQHIETEQGPFLRKEQLMEIIIHTAATSHKIEGLEIEEAKKLREQIINMIKVAEQDV
ncbi:PH domain-containing protein [Vagococcus xieshaowenii]|uniref:YdbS-like PH domain-containing protein n=1 Tax=Vagococcus xieshaowenii TaxID=2562451 RepID=A0A4Z0DAN2_9ENTE|nr:PH domain-containing protein [Vagococcus xieshaowenii]QCA29209.1 hypothetical protein E4Z98_07715 [Vagococcus xieshaowenii]TFZ41941.1 hypothetical protein E4031_04560 [Vagococcus xieshaowenii]